MPRTPPPDPATPFDQADAVTDADLRRVVLWAFDWHGIDRPESPFPIMVQVRECLRGAAVPKEHVIGRSRRLVVATAFRAVYAQVDRAAAFRTARTLPYLQLCPIRDRTCPAALRLSERLTRVADAPLLPLADCDAERCGCRYRQLSAGMAQREGHRLPV